jgi:hypothetical protein
MRQWLPEYFATVIDLLIEKNQVNAVLVGGHDEMELAEEVMGHIVNRGSVVSLVGRTSLGDLRGCCVRARCIWETTAARSILPPRWACRRSVFIPAWWMRRSGGRPGLARLRCSGIWCAARAIC